MNERETELTQLKDAVKWVKHEMDKLAKLEKAIKAQAEHLTKVWSNANDRIKQLEAEQ